MKYFKLGLEYSPLLLISDIRPHNIYIDFLPPSLLCRWGLMTLTTVGYDYNPETLLGKIIGGCCALSGVSVLILLLLLILNLILLHFLLIST